MTDLVIKTARLNVLKEIIQTCHNCPLGLTRTKIVFGEGPENPKFLSLAEAPGKEEDSTGRPFVGRAGRLYRQVLQAIGICPEKDVYMCNILKCRPPDNRVPESSEIGECIKFLLKQIEIISPGLILLLGRTAVKGLLPEYSDVPMNKLRDISKTGSLSYKNTPILVTYHPSALLHDPSKKICFKEDFLHLKSIINN
jgi:DNA polymerase